MLRTLILKACSAVDGMGLEAEASRRFSALCADYNAVHPELRDVIANVCVRNGGAAEYDAVLAMYRANNEHAETRVKCLMSLGKTK
jgi:hypothetical protein